MAKERFLTVLIPITDSDAESTVYANEAALIAAVTPSADNVNKIYKLQDGTYRRSYYNSATSQYAYRAVVDREFPFIGEPLEIYDFTYDATRMGTAPSISANVMWFADKDSNNNDVTLEGLWTHRCHVIFNGENLYLKQIPSSGKSNEDARYKYELTFVSERIALENVYIYDVVAPFISDRPISESSTFSFYGDINELAKRINASLIRSGLSTLTRKYVPYPNYPELDVPYLTYEQWTLVNSDPSALYGTVFSTEDELLMFYSDIYTALNADYNRYLMAYVFENTNGVYDLSGYQCKIGRDEEGEITTSEEKQVSFENNTIHEALQQFHDTFELQYYIMNERDRGGHFTGNIFIIVGDCEYDFADFEYVLLLEEPEDWQTNYFEYYKIVSGNYVALEEPETFALDTYYKKEFSRDEDGIPTTESPFDYGVQNELLSKDKNNATDKIVTRITGVGSTDNIPWYYPNPCPDGWIRPFFTREGVEMPSVTIDYPLDEGTTPDDYVRYEKYLKNRIANSIKRGRLKQLISEIELVSLEDYYNEQETYYYIKTQYSIPVNGTADARVTLNFEYNELESGCDNVVASIYGVNSQHQIIRFADYDSSQTYNNPTDFQKLFINHDGGDVLQLSTGYTYYVTILYRIPSSSIPTSRLFDWEGYHYPSQMVYTTTQPVFTAYAAENFFDESDLMPFIRWAVGQSMVYIYEAGYSTNGEPSGKVSPIPRAVGQKYKDVSTGVIYKCTESRQPTSNTDFVYGNYKDAYEANPIMDSIEWVKTFVYLRLRVYVNDGWYLGNTRIELAGYGLGEPMSGGSVVVADIFDAIEFQRVKWLTAQSNLMPEVYIKTDGERRFYNAHNYWDAENETLLVGTADTALGEVQVQDKVRNPIYKEEETDADSEHYEFENEYVQQFPHEHIENFDDVKPTIKEQRNYVETEISEAVIEDWANQYQNYFTKNQDGTYSNATSTYDSSETYYMHLRIDVVEVFAYDETDNDEIWESNDGGSIEGEYKHPYFFAKLRPMGFNLFDLALQEDMVLSMTTGNCGACNFKIGVDENTRKNPVQIWEHDVYQGSDISTATKVYEAGDLRRYMNTEDLYYLIDGELVSVNSGLNILENTGVPQPDYPSAVTAYNRYEFSTEDVMNGLVGHTKKNGNLHFEGDVVTTGRFIDSQQDTSENYVWVALMKDTDSYGVLMPSAIPNYNDENYNVYIRPKSIEDVHTEESTYEEDEENADKFVIINIRMPQIYLRRAEHELSRKLVEYMHDNNIQKFNFSLKFSRIFMADNEDIDFNLNENSVLYVLFNGIVYRQYAKHYTYKMTKDASLPEINVDLNEELSVSRTLLQQWDAGRRRDSRSISSRVGTMVRQMTDRVSRTTLSRTDDTILSGNVYIRDRNTSLLEIEGGAGSAQSISIEEIDEITES